MQCSVRTSPTFLIIVDTLRTTVSDFVVVVHLSFGPTSVTNTFESNPVAFDAAVCCECSLLYKVHQPPFTQLSGFSFKMRTRLTVCVGTGGPHGHEGGLQGREQGGAEERGPTKTEERRQTGQPSKAGNNVLKTGRSTCMGHL